MFKNVDTDVRHFCNVVIYLFRYKNTFVV